ncbi:MAG: helix-turn-helix transcriptional regulator [Clostridiales bacterium]|nr:helix-turn-helix transcriptional regulator [Clostridiales bacterium]
MSESHIGRQFKAQTGKTVTQYINEVKVAEAKRLLDFDELTVTENAMQLGFSSQSYFQTVFKKITSYAGHLIRALHSHF